MTWSHYQVICWCLRWPDTIICCVLYHFFYIAVIVLVSGCSCEYNIQLRVLSRGNWIPLTEVLATSNIGNLTLFHIIVITVTPAMNCVEPAELKRLPSWFWTLQHPSQRSGKWMHRCSWCTELFHISEFAKEFDVKTVNEYILWPWLRPLLIIFPSVKFSGEYHCHEC